jgi:hypothetical protein
MFGCINANACFSFWLMSKAFLRTAEFGEKLINTLMLVQVKKTIFHKLFKAVAEIIH